MITDNTFRDVLVGVVLTFMPFALYFRIRSFTNEKLDRWQEGPWILFGLRLGALPAFIGGVTWIINPQWMAWSSVPLPIWIRWIGLALTISAGMLVVWTFYNLGRNLTDTVVTRKDHSLVTSGPYRYVRHPFYLAGALGFLGGSLVAANWYLLLTGLIPLSFLFVRTKIEEEKLVARFGDDYQDYMRRVGRFLPRLRG